MKYGLVLIAIFWTVMAITTTSCDSQVVMALLGALHATFGAAWPSTAGQKPDGKR